MRNDNTIVLKFNDNKGINILSNNNNNNNNNWTNGACILVIFIFFIFFSLFLCYSIIENEWMSSDFLLKWRPLLHYTRGAVCVCVSATTTNHKKRRIKKKKIERIRPFTFQISGMDIILHTQHKDTQNK